MAIITISRGTYGGGKTLAALLAKRLGYRAVSREELYEHIAQNYGFKSDEADELMLQAPTHGDLASPQTDRRSLGQRRRHLILAIQASLCELLEPDNSIYHGRAGHLFMAGIQHLLRVRIIATREQRVTWAAEREKISRLEATHRMDTIDAEHQRWIMAMFGANWSDPSIVDVVLNLEAQTLDEAADTIAFMSKQASYQSTPASVRALKQLGLKSRVLAHLAAQPETTKIDVEIEVDADTGQVTLQGRLDPIRRELVSGEVKKVHGVSAVVG